MPTVMIDGQEIEIGSDERLNGIQVAARAGIDIPHYCWHPGLSVVASCRMCLVESGRRDATTGQVSMIPKLVPACQTPATDGTVFVTHSEQVINARAMVEEDLLIRHPIDCPICDKAGECSLQDYHFAHGREQRRADIQPFTSRRRDLGETVTLFVDRCVMCSRCVRFCREVSETKELMVVNRGVHEEIDVFPGFPLDNKLSGNVVDLCPVGALGDRDFLYQQRVWFMKKHDGVCAGCATGCSIEVEENQDRVYRLKPRHNPQVNDWWMCDEGRYGWKHVHDARRLAGPRIREQDSWTDVEWSELLAPLDQRLRAAGRMAMVISPHLTVEEAYLAAKYARDVDSQALLVLGPVPAKGQDESFSNGFTICAEKCPNRMGVEKILEFFEGETATWPEFVETRLETDNILALWVTGGYKSDFADADVAERCRRVSTLVVHDLFESPLSSVADYQLPAVSFAERDGSYVNRAGHLQSFEWAVRPPAGAWSDGSVFWALTGGSGLFRARPVMQVIAGEAGYFSPAIDPVASTGSALEQLVVAKS